MLNLTRACKRLIFLKTIFIPLNTFLLKRKNKKKYKFLKTRKKIIVEMNETGKVSIGVAARARKSITPFSDQHMIQV